MDSVEQCRNRNAPHRRAAVRTLLGADAIDSVEFRSIRFPHAGQSRQMIDLVNPRRGLMHQARVEYRAFNIFHCRQGPGRQADVENAHLPAAREEFGYQMLADEAAAASNEYACHKWRFRSFQRSTG